MLGIRRGDNGVHGGIRTTLAEGLARGVSLLRDVVFPPACAACGASMASSEEGRLCRACLAGIVRIRSPFCTVCGDPFDGPPGTDHLCGVCIGNPPSYDRARSLFAFAGPVRELVHRVKFHDCGHALAALSGVSRHVLGEAFEDPGLVVPVPLHIRRLRNRGFNQSARIAKEIFPENRVAVDLIRKVRDTRPQTGLDARDRSANVRGVFALERPLPPHVKRVTVVDDVFTTGATVSECARILKLGGAEEVWVLTMARAIRGVT